jgi:type II restriction/modification system DNA methylase subunit YeeA
VSGEYDQSAADTVGAALTRTSRPGIAAGVPRPPDCRTLRSMTPTEFAAKWSGVTTGERASAQSHFLDLCAMLGEPGPTQADPTGSWYAFEKGAGKLAGGDGFADVWKRGFFAWEYKGKRKDLKAAYLQLQGYRDALENPPLLVVSDLGRIEVRTNFTGLSPVTKVVTLEDLAAPDPSEALAILRAVFTAPEELRPTFEPAEITEAAARHFAELAQVLRARGHEPQVVAHFLDRILFCLFAEDAAILPTGVLSRLAEKTRGRPHVFGDALGQMFGLMSRGGGMFGTEEVPWFNGGLFDSADVLPLTEAEIGTLLEVGRLNWALIEPAIFGTLFERGLDPDRRAQLGAHYTAREQIWQLVEPVVIRPLRREYGAMQARVTGLLLAGRKVTRATKPEENPRLVFRAFLERLRRVRVLDPACGSGNFLFVTLGALKDLEWEAIQWGSLVLQEPGEFPRIGPEAVLGIEINAYAAELARVTIWIGEIQWMLRHGLGYRRDPILSPLHHIETRDALLDRSDPANPREAEWPAAEFIVGNPPFLGAKLLRRGLGNDYVETLFGIFGDRLPGMADLSAYWHEKARAAIAAGRTKRAGLLATQSIRGGGSRRALERIKDAGDIFFARSDDPWVLSGANVHISFVGQDDGSETERELDGRAVDSINANLTSGVDVTQARRLRENQGIAFIGDQKSGPFEISADLAAQVIASPNPDGRSNRDVVRPWVNGDDLAGRIRGLWIIDFGVDMAEAEASLYETPFEHVRAHVRPRRLASGIGAEIWWLHWRPRPEFRVASRDLPRYIATPMTAKHRLFVWLDAHVVPHNALVAIARDDDYTFGVLHSRVHEAWARATGTQLREVESGFRYTPTTCFETFPFPRPTDEQREAIAAAARDLVRLRDGWLNPPGLDPDALSKRTLTNLYNARPTWLQHAHATLDTAVLAAYGWPADLPTVEVLARLLALNLEREPA